MIIADQAGTILPRGLQFLELGWWASHALAIFLIWGYAYRKGRKDERKDRGAPPRPPDPPGPSA